MYGFHPKKNKASQVKNYANGGIVKGPGTGRSDDVPAVVPVGSYVLPADTTQALGFKPGMRSKMTHQGTGAALGFKPRSREVMLSNGEAVLNGEQVHAAGGVESLDALRAVTHVQVPEQVAPVEEPRFFFVNGGLVDEKQQRLNSFGDAAAAAANPSVTQVAPVVRERDVRQSQMSASDHQSTGALAETTARYESTGAQEAAAARSAAAGRTSNAAIRPFRQETFPASSAGAGRGFGFPGQTPSDRVKQASTGSGPEQVGRGFNPFPKTTEAVKMTGEDIGTAYRQGGAAAAIGQGIRSSMVPTFGLVDDLAGRAANALGFPAQILKTAVTGDATPIGQEPPASPASAVRSSAAVPAVRPPAQPLASGLPEKPGTPAAQANVQATTPPAGNVNVQRQANGVMSFSGQDVAGDVSYNGARAAGFRPRGAGVSVVPSAPGLGFQPTQQAAAPVTPAPAVIPQDTGGYGLLDKSRLQQRSLMMDLQQMKPGSGTALKGFLQQQADAPGQQIERDKMAADVAAGAADRSLRSEELQSARGFRAGQLANETARIGLEGQRVGSDLEARGFEISQARRMENLRAKYESATDQKAKAELAQQLNTLAGKTQPADDYMSISGGEALDTMGTPYKNPDLIVNRRTGEVVDVGATRRTERMLNDIAILRGKPSLAEKFDSIYGKGAAAKILSKP